MPKAGHGSRPEPASQAGRGKRPSRAGLRRYRLSGAGAFEALLRAGSRREGSWLQLVAAPAATVPGRAGLIVGAKVLPEAVARNRVRRTLRVALAGARPAIEAYDVILRLRRPCARHEVPVVAAEAAALLAALGRAATAERR